MITLFFWLCFTMFNVEANSPDTENPVIYLNFSDQETKCFTVWINKPLKIAIQDGGKIRQIWCDDFYKNYTSEKFMPSTDYENGIDILDIPKVMANMSTRWRCSTLQIPYLINNHQYTAKNIYFRLHVKGTRPVIVTANKYKLSYVTTNLSVTYDGDTNFTYEDGADIAFSCNIPKDDFQEDGLRMEYYNAEGVLQFKTETEERNPITLRSVLKLSNNEYYLDCTRFSRELNTEYRYRTTFYMKAKDPMVHNVILSVNGQKLTAASNNKSDYIDDYVFKYIDGEILNVTCQKTDSNMPSTLRIFNKDTKWDGFALQTSSGNMVSFNISTSNVSNETLVCDIKNKDVKKPVAMLLLTSDVPNHGVRIRGLPRNNILYQYSNGAHSLIIEYQYSVHATLNLTCVYNAGESADNVRSRSLSFLWQFEGKTIDSPAIDIERATIRYSKEAFTKVLDESHNGTKIKCIHMDFKFNTISSVEIILRLKLELNSNAVKDEIFSGASSKISKALIYSLSTVGVAIFIIVVVIVRKCHCAAMSNSQQLPSATTPLGPETPFYENLLAVFLRVNKKEAVELEHQYEVVL